MNRIEYMTKLASLLQDIPEVERRDAMKYYNDYFDEAGEENEEQVIREFGAPEEVAENIKADLKGKTENTTHAQQEEHQSAGQQYQMNHQENKQSSEYQYGTSDNQKKKNAQYWKIVLIVALAIIIGPVLIPIIGGILAAGLAMVLTIIVGVFALVIAGGCHCNCRNFAGNIRFRYTSATDGRRIGIDWQRSDHNGSWCGCNSRIWKTL